MSINIGPPSVDGLKPKIAVIGVGGAGGNAIANMIAAQVEGVDFVVANTDAQALNSSPAENRIQLGPEITEGLGAGSRPEVGRAAAEETLEQINEVLDGAHMCFIAAGMGGGTGTGAAPVIAKAAREKNILTVGVVTKPFMFEGTRRMRSADSGIEELQEHVDTLIVIPNQNLFLVANPNTTFKEAFEMADDVLQQGVRGITDLMVMPGLVNLDFADVRSVMHEMGKAMMGTGEADGDDRALQAAEAAIANPLLDGVSMQGAKGVIISITGGEDMRLMEVDQAASHIRELVDPEANIIWGSAFNPDLDGKIRVSVVATGIDSDDMGARSGGGQADRPFAFARSSAPKKAEPVAEEGAVEEVEEAPAAFASDAGRDSGDNDGNVTAFAPKPGFAADPIVEDVEEDEDEGDVPPRFLSTSPSRSDEDAATPAFASDTPMASEMKPTSDEPAAFEADEAEEEGDDELLELGSAEMLPPEEEKPAPSPTVTERPRPASKAAAPAGEKTAGARHPLRSEEARSAPRLQTGGPTLFERMANLSRGGGKQEIEEDEGEDEEAFNIPRFLNRQNNK